MRKSPGPKLCAFLWFLFFSVLPAWPATLNAQGSPDPVRQAVQNMELVTGAPIEVTLSPITGLATFVATKAGRPIPVAGLPAASPKERALSFLASHGQAFGLQDPSQVRVTRAQGPDGVGMDHVRLQQVHNGVPVTGGEITVTLRGSNVVAVNAKTLSELKGINTVPSVSASLALSSAQGLLAKQLGVTDVTLSEPRLEIFNRGILEGARYPTQLAWFIEATRLDVRELIWIDAHTGLILLHFSQLADALSRSIYTARNTAILPGTLLRSEGSPSTGDADADTAYTFSGDTYNYFYTQHGRDSYDNAGSSLISTVHYCPDSVNCPYRNAFWNGAQMVYGEGFSHADDVDAHELTHAVTEHSAKLFYYMQSGSLNESYSDIFGETVDLTNGGGTDTPAVRWLMGEDIPGLGAIRNMMAPTALGDPGKMSDPQFVCSDPGGDSGGVHSNSGVPNHAYALMVDGGSYNGFTITGIGLTKAGKIQYRALTQYLLSASDFLDNYNALKQSCTDLIGTAGITAADCSEVNKALDAVEMSRPWPCSSPQVAVSDLCPLGQTPTDLFFDNLEGGGGNWVISTPIGPNLWFLGDFFATSGVFHLYGDDSNTTGDSRDQMNLNVAIPAGARMQFNHSYGFENDSLSNYDGGVLEYSTDSGATWSDAGNLISAGARYGGTISSCCGNPLAGKNAFVRDSFGYTASQLDLSSLAGQNVRFRFRIGTDGDIGDFGWFIDDIRIYQCNPASTPVNLFASITGSGTVTSSPPGINCPGDCNENYARDTIVTLAATPVTGWRFTGWTGDPDCVDGSLTMTADKTCTATFLQQFTLSVTKSGTGSGTVTSSPAGINCGADCSEPYNNGTVVTLTATPNTGSIFAGWSGDADCSDGQVSMNAGKTCTATFNLPRYSILGKVTTSTGAALSGVVVTLGGAGTGTATTDTYGNYQFTGLPNGTYTLTPGKTGYTFTPTSRTVTVNGANVTGQNFTGSASGGGGAYAISGRATTSTGAALSGVGVTLSGAGSGTATTDTYGNYTFTGRANGTYTLTPGKTGYTFTPTSRTVTVNGASVTSQNFTGSASGGGGAYAISGRATTSTGWVLPGVVVTLGGAGTGMATTDTYGNYTFTGRANGTYSLTPGKTGYTFTPTSRTVTVNGANVMGQNFTGWTVK